MFGIVTLHFEIALELAVQLFGFQCDDDLSPPAGLDVRIKPHHLHTSGVFDFGNGKEGVSGVKDLKGLQDIFFGFRYISGIVIIRGNGNGRAAPGISPLSRRVGAVG